MGDIAEYLHIYPNKPVERGKLMMQERRQWQEQGTCMENAEESQGPGECWPWRGTQTVTEGALQQEEYRMQGRRCRHLIDLVVHLWKLSYYAFIF